MPYGVACNGVSARQVWHRIATHAMSVPGIA
jgi:hypothetical protein